MNKKSDKPKNRINAVKNNFFALKLLWSICPKLVVHKAIRVILDYAGWLFDYEYRRLGIPAPDLVIFLDVDPEISQKLIFGRYQGDESKKDIHVLAPP